MRSARCSAARLGHFTKRIKGLLDVLVSGVGEDLAEHADTFRRDLRPALRTHYALANPPFIGFTELRTAADVP